MSPSHAIAHSGIRKAAVLLVLLGEEVASLIFRNLNENELQKVTQEISDVGAVDPAEATAILNEYHNLTITQDYIAQGGTEYAERLLVKTLGPDGARLMLESVSRAQELSAQQARLTAEGRSPAARQIPSRRTSADHRSHHGPSRPQASLGVA